MSFVVKWWVYSFKTDESCVPNDELFAGEEVDVAQQFAPFYQPIDEIRDYFGDHVAVRVQLNMTIFCTKIHPFNAIRRRWISHKNNVRAKNGEVRTESDDFRAKRWWFS